MTFNQEQAEAALAKWQKILRLQDWDIKIFIYRAKDLMTDGQAEVTWLREKKQAILKLLDPIDYDNNYFIQDHEVSIVHELLHCHMALFDQEAGTLEDIAQEQAIHALSFALVELDRKNREGEDFSGKVFGS